MVHIDVESNLSCHRLNINLLNSSINIVYLFFGNYLFKSVRVNNLPIENIIFYHILAWLTSQLPKIMDASKAWKVLDQA